MPRTRKDKVGFLFIFFSFAGALALVLAYISVYLPPSRLSSVLMFFGLYFIPILFFNLLMFFIGLLRLKTMALVTFTVMLPTLFYADFFIKLNQKEEIPQGQPFKILTYNVGQMRLSRDGTESEANTGRIAVFLEQEQPGIVCLQEFSARDGAAYDSFADGFPFRHQYFFGSRRLIGNAVLSRYPIVDKGSIVFEVSHNMCIWADIEVPGGIVRVYNCHLQSPTISFTSLIRRMAVKGALASEVREVHEKLRVSNRQRALQVEEILAHASQCDYPVVICGDFNDTPVSHTYYRLHKGRKDSFAEAGKGFGASYSYLWPLLRIDYILLPKEFTAFRNEIKREKYSDHFPVSTYIYR